MGDDLTDFLLARIAEREAVARAAIPGPWYWTEGSNQGGPDLMSRGAVVGTRGPRGAKRNYLRTLDEQLPPDADPAFSEDPATVLAGVGYDEWGTAVEPEDQAHIALNDPTYVLAECEAKRRIVEEFLANTKANYWEREAPGLEIALRYLALPYAGHPDYQPEWKP